MVKLELPGGSCPPLFSLLTVIIHRYAIAMALRSFVDKRTVDDMKLVGLLTQDIRVRERKKPGKVSARKSYTWKRR